MNQKINKLFLCALGVMAMMACNKENTGGDTPTGGAEGLPAVASISFTQNGPGTYAGTGESAATQSEKTITKATVLVFDASNQLEQTLEFDRTTTQKRFQTTTGKKTLFVMGNFDGTALNPAFTPQVGRFSVTDLMKQVHAVTAADIATMSTADNFYLTNAASSGTGLTEFTVTSNQAQNNVSIPVGRMLAKTVLKTDNMNLAAAGLLALNDVQARPINIPNKVNVVHRYDAQHVLQTPLFGDMTEANYFDVPDYAATGTPMYIMENSHDGAKILRSNTTMLLVKGTWVPAADAIMDENNANTGVLTNGTFYAVRNKTTGVIITKPVFNASPTPAVVAALAGSAGNGEIVEYTNGVCYYSIFIAKTGEQNLARKYQVERNNLYTMIINNVNGLGYNTEAGVIGAPSDPVEESTELDVTVSVVDWVDNTIHGDLQ